jgi:iron complex transport system substrate-binding protein
MHDFRAQCRRRLVAAVLITVLSGMLPLVAAAQGTPVASPVAYPLTLPDCVGGTVTFDKVPERIVTLDAYAAEFVIALGFGDRIVGTGFPHPEQQIPAELKDDFARIPVLAGGLAGDMAALPSKEVIAAARPDLVLTAYSELLGTADGQINPVDMSAIGAISFADCFDVSSSVVTNIDGTYRFAEQLGQIFGVPDRATQLVDAMRARQDTVTARVASLPQTRIVVIATDPNDGQPIATFGGASLSNGIMTLAGCANIFGDEPSPGFFPSAEEVAQRDPQVILVLTDYSTDDGDALTAAIQSNAVLAGTSAARDGHFVVMSHVIVGGASPRNIDAVEALAAACHPAN